jgi:hypothetical protein
MSKIPTDPDEVLAQLSELSAALYDGLAVGSLAVQKYFEGLRKEIGIPNLEINRPMATDMMRFRTFLHVTRNRKIGVPYHIEQLTNNGLSFRFDWCHIKVYKGMEGNPPTAHNTHKSRLFYSHNQPTPAQMKLRGIVWRKNWQFLEWEKVVPTLDRAHFIYCWEVDPQYNVNRFQLFAPRESGRYKQGVKLFWRREVPHPILGIKGLPTVNDHEEADDLPVFFEDAAEEGDDG